MAWHRGQAYGQDLRARVLAASGTNAEVAMRFDVSQSYVSRVRANYQRRQQATPGAQCNHMPPKLAGLEQALAEQVAANNDLTLAQLCEWAKQEHGVTVSLATMWTTLARLGLSLKKSRCMRSSRIAPT